MCLRFKSTLSGLTVVLDFTSHKLKQKKEDVANLTHPPDLAFQITGVYS